MRLFFQTIFYASRSPLFVCVNRFLSGVIILSLLLLLCETVSGLKQYAPLFRVVELIITLVFTLEYVGRIVGHKKPFRYIFSFFGFIDLIAIIPTYLGLGNLTFLKSLRGLRILRFLRVLRVMKLMEIKHKKSDSHELFFLTLEIYATLFLAVALFSATGMWLAEGFRPEFSNIPVALLWSMKVLLGGVYQAIPQTIAGELIIITTRFFGVLLFALLINIVLNPIRQYLLIEHDQDTSSL